MEPNEVVSVTIAMLAFAGGSDSALISLSFGRVPLPTTGGCREHSLFRTQRACGSGPDGEALAHLVQGTESPVAWGARAAVGSATRLSQHCAPQDDASEHHTHTLQPRRASQALQQASAVAASWLAPPAFEPATT